MLGRARLTDHAFRHCAGKFGGRHPDQRLPRADDPLLARRARLRVCAEGLRTCAVAMPAARSVAAELRTRTDPTATIYAGRSRPEIAILRLAGLFWCCNIVPVAQARKLRAIRAVDVIAFDFAQARQPRTALAAPLPPVDSRSNPGIALRPSDCHRSMRTSARRHRRDRRPCGIVQQGRQATAPDRSRRDRDKRCRIRGIAIPVPCTAKCSSA